MLTKTLCFESDVLDVIRAMEFSPDGCLGKIKGQLTRDLYTRVNKALEAMGGKWNRGKQGHVFAADPRPSVDGLLDSGTLQVTRDGFFETPRWIVERMIAEVGIPASAFVLEPEAGLGAIARVLLENGVVGSHLMCVEKNLSRAEKLNAAGFNVLCGDFLAIELSGRFDRIFMNPPFEQLQDVDHVRRAYEYLKEGGALVAIMSESPFFREDRKAQEFREWLESVDGYSEELPEGSFKASGTGVNTRLVVIW